MAKRVLNKLDARTVASLKVPGRYSDGGGLYLMIDDSRRRWVFMYSRNGKRVELGLGGARDVPLARVRAEATKMRATLASGGDPKAERAKSDAAWTFKEAAKAYILANEASWKNEKHGAQWASTLEAYAYPTMGELPVASISSAHVLAALEPIWRTKTETASRVRGRIESVLDYAKVKGHREGENPARWRGHLEFTLPKRSKVSKVEHHAALPYVDVAAFMERLRSREGVSARALEFAILCASRSGEVRHATWAEIDLKAKRWIIPAGRMKAEREHHVPLSAAAVAILEGLKAGEGGDHLFTAPKGGALSDMSLTAVLKRMGHGDLTQHGFRSTFRDWAGETTAFPREVIEHALAHGLKDKTEAAYQRGTLFDKRVQLMAAWADHCRLIPSLTDHEPEEQALA